MKIYGKMSDVLNGTTDLPNAEPSIQSCVRLPLYLKACQILDLPTKEERKAEVAKAPPLIRPYLEEEIMRIWDLRRSS